MNTIEEVFQCQHLGRAFHSERGDEKPTLRLYCGIYDAFTSTDFCRGCLVCAPVVVEDCVPEGIQVP